MAKEKFDAVVDAVHYNLDGNVEWVRIFERRGPTWSDYVLVSRQKLVEELKAGKKYMVGKRVQYEASTFDVTVPLTLIQNGKDILTTVNSKSEVDLLEGVPVI